MDGPIAGGDEVPAVARQARGNFLVQASKARLFPTCWTKESGGLETGPAKPGVWSVQALILDLIGTVMENLERWAAGRRVLPCALASALLLLASLGCGSNNGRGVPCDGAPVAGTVSLWTECEADGRASRPLEFYLTNDSSETVWYLDHCSESVPWLARSEGDGTWTPLVPDDYWPALDCEHVEFLEPGESLALLVPVEGLQQDGTHRVEQQVARGCVDVHDPRHWASGCETISLVVSEEFELWR